MEKGEVAANRKGNFQPLTPVKANISNYMDCFEYVFRSADLRNIALTGSYSSGKSSIMLGVESAFPKERFLRISLAHFEASDGQAASSMVEHDDDQDGETNKSDHCNKGSFSENVIEGKILNQLVHRLKPTSIPSSRFKKTKKTRFFTGYARTLVIVAFLISTAALLNIEHVYALMPNTSLADKASSVLRGTWCLSLFIGVLAFVQGRVFTAPLKSVGFLGGNVEVFNEGEGSCFDRYLDDILYMIESSGASVIVFEDLDRFGKPEIFEKLREINDLANSQPTLFNQWKLTKLCDDKDHKHPLSKSPCVRFFYLINDDVFSAKERVKFFDFIIPVIPYINNSTSAGVLIERLTNEGEVASSAFLEELSVFVDDPRILNDVVNEYQIYKSNLPPDIASSKKGQETLLGLMAYKVLFPADFSALQRGEGYIYELLHSRATEMKKILAEEHSPEHISALDLAERIALFGADDYFEGKVGNTEDAKTAYAEIIDNKYFQLISYLIGNGVVDESYVAYISLFREGRLSNNDEAFRKNVLIRRAVDQNQPLDDVRQVISKLHSHRFAEPAARNYALLSGLLRIGENEKLSAFFEGLRKDDDTAFLLGYTESDSYTPAVFDSLYNQWDNYIRLVSDNAFALERKRRFVHLVLNDDPRLIKKENARTLICDFANQDSSFLCVDSSFWTEVFKNALLELPYCAETIDFKKVNQDCVAYVIEKNLYSTNPEFICHLLANGCGIPEDQCHQSRLATVLFDAKEGSLEGFVADRVCEIVTKCVASEAYASRDDEDAALWILNEESLDEGVRLRYAESLIGTRISDLTNVEERFWQTLMAGDSVQFTEKNVYEYYRHLGKSFDAVFIGYLNRNAKAGVLTVAGQKSFFGGYAYFATRLLERNDLTDEAFVLIFSSYGGGLKQLKKADLSNTKIECLVSSGVLEMNAQSLAFIRANYKDYVPCFYEANSEEYAELVGSSQVAADLQEEQGFLLSSKVEEAVKVKSLGPSGRRARSVNKSYSDEVNIAIIEHHLAEEDLNGPLGELYGRSSEGLDKAIVARYAKEITSGRTDILLNMGLIIALLESNSLTENKKKLILSFNIDALSDTQVGICLKIMGDERYLAVWSGNNRKIEVDSANEVLIESMRRCGYCGEQHLINKEAKEVMLYGLSRRLETTRKVLDAISNDDEMKVIKILAKRDCSVQGMASLLNLDKAYIAEAVNDLVVAGIVESTEFVDGQIAYHLV